MASPALVDGFLVVLSPGNHLHRLEFDPSVDACEVLFSHLTNGQEYTATVAIEYTTGDIDRAVAVRATPIRPKLSDPTEVVAQVDAHGFKRCSSCFQRSPSLVVSWQAGPVHPAFPTLRYRIEATPGGRRTAVNLPFLVCVQCLNR